MCLPRPLQQEGYCRRDAENEDEQAHAPQIILRRQPKARPLSFVVTIRLRKNGINRLA